MKSTQYAKNIYWVYGVVLDDKYDLEAAEVMRRLNAKGVGTRPFFWPMHEQPIFKKMGLFHGVSCPVSERIARKGFYIPSGMALSSEQIHQVSNAMHEVFN